MKAIEGPPVRRVGIVLAGGAGTRLYPLTLAQNKQLLPVYDKPMIFYPLATLMLAGIREIVLVSSPEALPDFKRCIGDGGRWGLTISYAEQKRPEGIAQAFLVAEEHIAGRPVALILGDNLFFGAGLAERLSRSNRRAEGATIFGYPVLDPSRFGVATVSPDGKVLSIEEKPVRPTSNLAVPGLYFYDQQVVEIARGLKPSPRGELEITDVNRAYLERNQLFIERLGRGSAWLDGGTHEALFDAAQFVRVIEERTGLKIACLEEVAYRMGYIDLNELSNQVAVMPSNSYASYLKNIVETEIAEGTARQ